MKPDKVHYVISLNSKDNVGNKMDPKKMISFEADGDLHNLLREGPSFDKNNDGKVDANEFRSTLEADGYKLTSGENEFNALFKEGLKVDGSDFVVPGGPILDKNGKDTGKKYEDMTVKNGGFGKIEKSLYDKGYGLLMSVGDMPIGNNPNVIPELPGIKPLPPIPGKKK